MKRTVLSVILLTAVLGSAVTPSLSGSASAANHVRSHAALFDKTRFLLHMGLAYFAFHHFVYAKWKAGDFKSGASHRTSNIIKAALAVLFTYHELHKAYDIAKGSHSKTLHLLIAPLSALFGLFNSAYAKAKKGQLPDSTMSGLNGSAGSFASTAGKAGYGFHDITTVVPGL
jgi:hypothetical protein